MATMTAFASAPEAEKRARVTTFTRLSQTAGGLVTVCETAHAGLQPSTDAKFSSASKQLKRLGPSPPPTPYLPPTLKLETHAPGSPMMGRLPHAQVANGPFDHYNGRARASWSSSLSSSASSCAAASSASWVDQDNNSVSYSPDGQPLEDRGGDILWSGDAEPINSPPTFTPRLRFFRANLAKVDAAIRFAKEAMEFEDTSVSLASDYGKTESVVEQRFRPRTPTEQHGGLDSQHRSTQNKILGPPTRDRDVYCKPTTGDFEVRERRFRPRTPAELHLSLDTQHLFQKILGPVTMVDLQVIDDDEVDVGHDHLQGQTAKDISSADNGDAEHDVLQRLAAADRQTPRTNKHAVLTREGIDDQRSQPSIDHAPINNTFWTGREFTF
jgi:hypothetical protein